MMPLSSPKPGRYPLWLARAGLLSLALAGVADIHLMALPHLHFFFGLMTAAALSGFLASLPRRAAGRAAAAVPTAIFAALAFLELGTLAWPHLAGQGSGGTAVTDRATGRFWTRSDPQFGYVPIAATGAFRAIKHKPDGTLAYDVTYTLEDGIRATKGDPAGPCSVLFMIDSVAFGEGLNDDDTLPWQFSAATGFKLNVVNLAFPGYGPHQMLRRIEDGWADRHVRARPAAAYYTVNDNHIWRQLGITPWNRFDPRHALDENGTVRHTGRFHGFPDWTAPWPQFRRELVGFLRGSTFFTNARGFPEWNRADDIRHAKRMFVAVVAQTHRALMKRWGVPLTLLIHVENPWVDSMYAELERQGIAVLRYRDFIGTPVPGVHVIAGDGHPTRLANQLVARALAERFPACR